MEELERWCSGGCSVFVVCVEADLYNESDTRELPPAGQTFVHKIYHEMSVKQMTVDIQAAIWPAPKTLALSRSRYWGGFIVVVPIHQVTFQRDFSRL
jgi:hypothetical protein